MAGDGDALIRRRLGCRGVVQGVGFRPAVFRLAKALQLDGFVRNDVDGACIEVQGPAAAVQAFVDALPAGLPPLASLRQLAVEVLPPQPGRGFAVEDSGGGRRGEALVPPDVALCAACRRELDDPRDRRHRYAFTTCTDCGPRFSLVRQLPYDRAQTAMACFPPCRRCAAEYADPADRRFHAEPVCCPDCGPRLWLCDAGGRELAAGPAALAAVRRQLAAGGIAAIKGLGGFQLACRADEAAAVAELRRRKQRPTRPLAVMARDAAAAAALVQLSAADLRLLQSPAAPIVLAPRRPDAAVADAVAPGLGDLGVMLPTTPLHVELFRDAGYPALVMTSGNRSDEPICLGNREALQRLCGLADVFLLHDRDIVRRVDDSVVRAAAGGAFVLRRSRGQVPLPLPLPLPAAPPVLALGGHLQATVCLAHGEQAFLSQHVGDLDSEPARAFLREVLDGLEQFLAVHCRVLVADQHPDYPSAWLARELAAARGGRLLLVQHHLAHAAAVLGEHAAVPAPGERAAALVLDGTGSGADGTAWGSELLLLDGALRWTRAGCGEALPLVGGEAAVRQPWRVAAAALAGSDCERQLHRLPLAALVAPARLQAVAALAARPGWPQAHGAGRLFEAAGALLGLCAENGYEGEAACRLEALAATAAGSPTATLATAGDRPWAEVALPAAPRLPHRALLCAMARRLLAGEDPAAVAAGLLCSYAALAVQLAQRTLPADVRTVALAGGCFANRLLRASIATGLAAAGLRPLLPLQLPPGDGGLAYGQAVLAAIAQVRGAAPEFVASVAGVPSPEGQPCA